MGTAEPPEQPAGPAEEESRRNEQRLRLAVQVADIGIFDHDHVTDTIYWSPRQRAIYGLPLDTRITLPMFLALLHPEDREAIAVAVRRAHDPLGDGRFDVENRIVRSDGRVRWTATRSITQFEGEAGARRPVRTVGAVIDITERRLAEEDRRLKENAIATASTAIVITDARGCVSYVNPAFMTLWGYAAPAQVLGRASEDFVVDPAQVHAAMAEAAHNGSFHGELKARRSDGQAFIVECSVSVVRDAAGAVTHMMGSFLDVTRRNEHEAELQRSEQRFRALVDLSSDWYWQTDAEHRFTFRDGEILRRMGIPPAEDYGLRRWEMSGFTNMTEADWAAHRAKLERREEFRDLLLERRSPDGRVHWATISGKPLFDEAGQFIGYHGTGRDITAQIRAERALRESEARISAAYATLNDAIDSSPAAIAVFDAGDRLIAFNSRLKALVPGRAERVQPGISFRDLAVGLSEGGSVARPPRAGDGWLQERLRAHHNPGVPMEIELAGGTWLQIVETRTTQGGIVVVYNDITDLKHREAELRRLASELESRVAERTAELAEANRELESFASTVAHDLRAPLRGIDGFGKLLDGRLGGNLDEESRGYLQRMRSSARRMGIIIDELLRFSRIGRSELRCRWVDLSQLARAVADELQRGAPQRAVQWDIDPGLRAWADAELMHLVFENLLGNAWKFTGKTAQPRIGFGAARGAAGEQEFFVRDNGAGFDMAHAKLLFQPFRRLHGQHEFEGTGIGLATVHRILQRHGGSIRGEATVGGGAEFRFSLPSPDSTAAP
jgi:PAS domain S-box-containing protein